MARKRPKLEISVWNKDCIAGLGMFDHAEAVKPKLIVADPPYNIGKEYLDHDDKMTPGDYREWCEDWITAIFETLDKHGSFWLVINDEWVCDLDVAARAAGFYRQNWVIWYYTFGVACQKSFSRSHTHLMHYTKLKKGYTFNADAVRVPSARQTVYGDKRALGKGKLPDNTWILRPQDEKQIFEPIEDTWFFNRICGTYHEREAHSPNQLPELMMERIVLVSSNKGDLVCDPFGGTFTTGVAAARHDRNFTGFDISKECCALGRKRLAKEKK